MCTSLQRHAWLEQAARFSAARLASVGCEVPAKTRVTIGFPSTGSKGKRIGECWSYLASTDQHCEILISPKMRDSVQIVATVLHELVHAAVGHEAKHGPLFKRPAVAAGLQGKMTATEAGPALTADIQAWLADVGDYPAGAIVAGDNGRKKQTTRLLKAECEACGYTVRITRKWLDDVGAPHCPDHGAMECV